MSERSPTIRNYVEDLLQACEYILEFTATKTEADFLNDVMLQFSVIRAIEILGEASKQVMETVPGASSRFSTIPLKEMYATRNRLIHGYSTVKPITVWRIVVHRIPAVHASVKALLANWPSDLA